MTANPDEPLSQLPRLGDGPTEIVAALEAHPKIDQLETDITATPMFLRVGEADFELAIYIEGISNGNISGLIDYRADLFEEETISRLLRNYFAILDRVIGADILQIHGNQNVVRQCLAVACPGPDVGHRRAFPACR